MTRKIPARCRVTKRCFVIGYLGDNRARFECEEHGHAFTKTLLRKDPRGKLPSEPMLRKMANWWKRPQGVSMQCPTCRRLST